MCRLWRAPEAEALFWLTCHLQPRRTTPRLPRADPCAPCSLRKFAPPALEHIWRCNRQPRRRRPKSSSRASQKRTQHQDLGRHHPADWPCWATVTTGENWPDRYNGKYTCTVREVACLQGFPTDYAFPGSLLDTKKQVVNAVPSPAVQIILEKVKRSIKRRDGQRDPEIGAVGSY